MFFGKFLIITGLIITVIGIIVSFAHNLPFLGRIPGDILIQKKNFTFYFPLATCLILSVILSFILWLISRR